MTLKDLLARGFFPKELPRPFVTARFADVVTSTGALPGDFAKTATTGNKLPTAKTGRYSHARGGLLRRPLHICNPLHYFLLCDELTQNWASIGPRVAGTVLSATSPESKGTGRAIDGKFPQSARPDLAQNTRLGRRYVLQTDINRFYNSIYTHSIPWALHTKATAKANRTLTLLGNRIDYWVRMGQDQQTIGIPIGPDTSLVLVELLMQRCDEQLLMKMPALKGHRFIDDYELSFQTRTQAEDAFHMLETCLAEYELALNPKKTQVLELPLPLEANWATELKRFTFRSTEKGQAADLSNYFSRAYSLHMENPGDPVLQFAVTTFRSVDIHLANWALFQKLLLLCVIPQPASFPYVLEQLILRKNAGATSILAELGEIVNALIIDHSALTHSSEVANALWACLALGLKLDPKAAEKVSQCDDPVVALLALDCEQHGLAAKSLDKGLWASHMTQEALYDEHWLLAYEANVKGWLPTVGGGDHVTADVNFSFLKKENVHFYEGGLASAPPAAPIPLPALPTVSTHTGSY
ncbi:MAG: RNA-directed DNA polymerase [Terriglobia bacterium]